jgi:hypothetical protein
MLVLPRVQPAELMGEAQIQANPAQSRVGFPQRRDARRITVAL